MAPNYRASDKLKDKVAIVTGGDSGIGRSVSVLFARQGADVGIMFLPAEQSDAEETAAAVEKEGRKALLVARDITDSKFCQSATASVVKRFGKLDILVNNAAYQQTQETLEAISVSEFELTFRTNVFGYFYMAKAALKFMAEGSCIINCGSITGLEGSPKVNCESSIVTLVVALLLRLPRIPQQVSMIIAVRRLRCVVFK